MLPPLGWALPLPNCVCMRVNACTQFAWICAHPCTHRASRVSSGVSALLKALVMLVVQDRQPAHLQAGAILPRLTAKAILGMDTVGASAAMSPAALRTSAREQGTPRQFFGPPGGRPPCASTPMHAHDREATAHLDGPGVRVGGGAHGQHSALRERELRQRVRDGASQQPGILAVVHDKAVAQRALRGTPENRTSAPCAPHLMPGASLARRRRPQPPTPRRSECFGAQAAPLLPRNGDSGFRIETCHTGTAVHAVAHAEHEGAAGEVHCEGRGAVDGAVQLDVISAWPHRGGDGIDPRRRQPHSCTHRNSESACPCGRGKIPLGKQARCGGRPTSDRCGVVHAGQEAGEVRAIERAGFGCVHHRAVLRARGHRHQATPAMRVP